MNLIDKISEKAEGLFNRKAEGTYQQLFRYTLTGGVAFLADIGALYICTEFLDMHYLISTAAGFCIGLIINYILSINWVFSGRKMKNRYAEFSIFAIIGIVGLGLNEILMYSFTDLLGIYYVYSKLITTVIVLFWNFFARKLVLFNQ